MQNKKIKIGLISLGCDKNRVDSEKLLFKCQEKYEICPNIQEVNVLIINTCAFLQSAREEAIETVFEYASLKKTGVLKKIILTGCLPQKFIDELFDDFTEVDGFIGTYDGSVILEVIERTLKGERVNLVGSGKELGCGRVVTTPDHFAYLKIADGCLNHCTYCLIPKIRGKYFSKPMEDIIAEAKTLGEREEVVLVAQDVTSYGVDLYGEKKIVELIKRLSQIDEIKRIRLLYCYPEQITDELILELKTNPKLVKYIDVPFQHASDRILKLMNRKGTFSSNLALVQKLKDSVEGITIRSTFIAGFPTETEEDFNVLCDFIKKAELENVGFFAYSKEEGTPAYNIKGHIHHKTKQRRVKTLYAIQQGIMNSIMQKRVGKTFTVVCDGVNLNKQAFYGRAYFQAPDIDSVIYLSSDDIIEQSKTYLVKITSVQDLDYYGEIINELT